MFGEIGLFQVGFGRDVTPEMFVSELPASVAVGRIVYGSADMNELRGMEPCAHDWKAVEALEYEGAIYTFHRSEVLGDLVSHVYLENPELEAE